MYRLKSPKVISGSVMAFGQSYDIVPEAKFRQYGTVDVPDLHTANFMAEHMGFQFMGLELFRRARRLVIRRGRGIGDILMVVPVARMLMRDDPDKEITLACDIPKMDLVKHLPWFRRVVPFSRLVLHQDKAWVTDPDGLNPEEQDAWLNLENLVEMDPDHAVFHRVDLFARAAGFGIPLAPHERTLEMRLTDTEAAAGKARLQAAGWHPGDRLLAMAVRSTCDNRNMPAGTFREVADRAGQEGWKVLILDHDASFGWEAPGVINMAGKTIGGEENRAVASMLVHATVFFGPDSGLWHMANALRVPNVAYFGAMDWRLRVTGPTRVLFRNVACYPCNTYGCHWHKRHACIELDGAGIWEEIKRHHQEVTGAGIKVTVPAAPQREMHALQAVGVGG